jgi:hypothetical protein
MVVGCEYLVFVAVYVFVTILYYLYIVFTSKRITKYLHVYKTIKYLKSDQILSSHLLVSHDH